MQKNGLVRLIYNHNPFYLISASLVLYGTQTSLAVDHFADVNFWPLAAALASCTLILAITAFLIVRFGQVWDDARSIFMILLLMFFAISVSFDELCFTNLGLASLMLGLGFAFAVVITEGLILSLRIKLPKQFRCSYYLMLGLTFFYPLVFSNKTSWYNVVDPRWLLMLFPVLAFLAMLTLLPAIRAGRQCVAKNGTPWVWPLYPWSVFAFLVVGLAGRSLMLCMAFDPSSGANSIWSLSFLAPMAIATAVLLLEIGLIESKRLLTQLAYALAFMTVPLSMCVDSSLAANVFMSEFVSAVGSPIWISAMLLLVFYTVSYLRGIEHSGYWLASLIVSCVFIDRHSLGYSLETMTAWPLFCLAGFQALRGIQHRDSVRMVTASLLGTMGVMILLHQSSFSIGILCLGGLHSMLLGALLTGWICNDKLASQLNAICAAVLVVFSLLAAGESLVGLFIPNLASAEIGMMGLLGVLFWKLNRDRLFAISAVASFALGLGTTGPMLAASVVGEGQQRFLVFMFVAFVCFAIGVFISTLKAGLRHQLGRQFSRLGLEVVSRFTVVEKRESHASST